jgi:four helix bundle protein
MKAAGNKMGQAANAERPTSNVQRSTSNGRKSEPSARYDLEERLLEYGVRIIRLVDSLPRSRSGEHIGSQLLRSGSSPMLHHGEVQAAESPKDFIHKLSICLKELRESRRALLIIERVPLAKNLGEVRALVEETAHLIRIFFASIRTVQRRLASKEGGTRDTDVPSSIVREDSLSLEIDWTLGVGHWTSDVLNAAQQETEAHVP